MGLFSVFNSSIAMEKENREKSKNQFWPSVTKVLPNIMYYTYLFTENGRLSNLTFWRPRAPSNYVVLGDCVTSRYL